LERSLKDKDTDIEYLGVTLDQREEASI